MIILIDGKFADFLSNVNIFSMMIGNYINGHYFKTIGFIDRQKDIQSL